MVPSPLFVFVSAGILFLVVTLVRFETRRGRRLFHGARSHLDFWLLKVRHTFNVRLRAWGRYFARQILHYFLHSILVATIRSLDAIEEALRSIARSNRSLAKKSDKERTERNKLEEIALHKLEVALTEEEKRIRKRKSLEG